MSIAKALGKRIRFLRQELGLTQAELAESCELSTNFIALLERGRNTPSLDTLERLARSLAVPVSGLFDFDAAGTSGKSREREKLMRRIAKLKSKRDIELISEMAGFLIRNRH